MKKYIILGLLILYSFSLAAQTLSTRRMKNSRGRHYSKNIVTDARGNLVYEDTEGTKASFSKDIFDNRIYKDSRNNEVSYSKEIWNDVFPDFRGKEKDILAYLVEAFYDTKEMKEKYKRNIHGNLEYENNKGLKASLSVNIFDAGVYKDNNNNEIKYSKEYWNEILPDFKNNDVQVFFWMMDQCYQLKNYKEEYKIDIFGYQQFSNNKNEKASLKKNVFDKMAYEDNKGNKKEYTLSEWNKISKRQGSEKKAFINLVQRYLFNN